MVDANIDQETEESGNATGQLLETRLLSWNIVATFKYMETEKLQINN